MEDRRRRAAISSSARDGHQPRVAGPGADQVDDARARALTPSASARSRISRGAGGEHPLGQRLAERRRLLGVAGDPVADPLAAVGQARVAAQHQLVALEAGADADRRVAARRRAPRTAARSAVSSISAARSVIRPAAAAASRVVGARLERQAALARRRGQLARARTETRSRRARPSRASPAVASTIPS